MLSVCKQNIGLLKCNYMFSGSMFGLAKVCPELSFIYICSIITMSQIQHQSMTCEFLKLRSHGKEATISQSTPLNCTLCQAHNIQIYWAFISRIILRADFSRSYVAVSASQQTGAGLRRGGLVSSCFSLSHGEEKFRHGLPNGNCLER